MSVFFTSCKTSSLHPDKTKFFAISTPSAPTPDKKIFAVDCLLTASIPKAPIYLEYLSFATSSFICEFFFILVSYDISIFSILSNFISFLVSFVLVFIIFELSIFFILFSIISCFSMESSNLIEYKTVFNSSLIFFNSLM